MLLILHILVVSFMVATLFVEAVVQVRMATLLREDESLRNKWRKNHMMAYHMSLVVAVITGLMLAMETDVMKTSGWLHAKLLLFLVLMFVGVLIGRLWKRPIYNRMIPAMYGFNVALLSAGIIFLAWGKPF